MQAIILAGGFGTRLRASVSHLPKPMAPIHERPFLAYLLDYLNYQGIKNVVFVVHYLREKIQAYFQSTYKGMHIDFVIEEGPLGTGGALLHALSSIKNIALCGPIFVLNGDTFVRLNYQTMLDAHKKNNALLTIALRHVNNCSRYSRADLKDNRIISFKEHGTDTPGFINAGVYLIDPKLFSSYQLPKHFSFKRDFILPFCSEIRPQAFTTDEYFIDIGEPDDYRRATYELH
jgi:D-glycero-alpha-D-manno-heptose 1-phosphate guanylyltransferase